MLQKARVGLFAQMVVVALFQRHRILTQVSGDHMEVIKLIPPLMIGDAEVKLFTEALADVLDGRVQGQRPDVGLRPDPDQAGRPVVGLRSAGQFKSNSKGGLCPRKERRNARHRPAAAEAFRIGAAFAPVITILPVHSQDHEISSWPSRELPPAAN